MTPRSGRLASVADRPVRARALVLVHSFSAMDAWLDDYQAFARRMGASGAEADVIVAVGERGGIPMYLSWDSDHSPIVATFEN
jgi:hypothetical protein